VETHLKLFIVLLDAAYQIAVKGKGFVLVAQIEMH
jgi:hypothetical protein